MAVTEQDLRLNILNTLLTTPHRKLAEVWTVHDEMAKQDPRFYVRLAAWYNDNGDVRDHKEMFVVTLALSAFPGHRDVGPGTSDTAIKRALANYLDIPAARLRDYVIDRHETGNLTVRPAAVFG